MCEALPYLWNGISITAAGTYKDTLVSATGCDSIATLNLTVSAAVTSTTNTTICAKALPYLWNGISITTAGTYKDTLVSATGCDSVTTLILVVNPVVTSTTNTTICAKALPYLWNGISITTAGTYKDTLISSKGCDSIATLNLTVSAAVTSTTNTTICAKALPYLWNGISITAAGTYKDTLISSKGL
jgi:energy-converting hydrogenase Eha subunit C